jgi:hypothetical protein
MHGIGAEAGTFAAAFREFAMTFGTMLVVEVGACCGGVRIMI